MCSSWLAILWVFIARGLAAEGQRRSVCVWNDLSTQTGCCAPEITLALLMSSKLHLLFLCSSTHSSRQEPRLGGWCDVVGGGFIRVSWVRNESGQRQEVWPQLLPSQVAGDFDMWYTNRILQLDSQSTCGSHPLRQATGWNIWNTLCQEVSSLLYRLLHQLCLLDD